MSNDFNEWDSLLEPKKKKKEEVKETKAKDREECPYCHREYVSLGHHLPYCSENPANQQQKKERESEQSELKEYIQALEERIKALESHKQDSESKGFLLSNLQIRTVWEALLRVERQLSGNRSKNFKRTVIPLREKLESYLKKNKIIK